MKKKFNFILMLIVALVMVGCNSNEPSNNNENGTESSNLDIVSTNKVTNLFGTVYEVILKDGNRMYFMVSGNSDVIMTGYHRFYGYADEENDNFAIYGYKDNLIVPSTIKLDNQEYTIVEVQGMGNISDNNHLTSVKLPETIKKIGNSAFSHCIALKEINIPSSVLEIEDFAFENCIQLSTINIPSSVLKIETSAFENCIQLSTINLPSKLYEIPSYCFQNDSNLLNVEGIKNVKKIGSDAFSKCISLPSTIELDSIEQIVWYSFEGCTNLRTIVLGPNCSEIGTGSFEYKSLTDIYCYAATPPDVSHFDLGSATFTLHVPASAINEYKESYSWSWYQDSGKEIERTIVPIE